MKKKIYQLEICWHILFWLILVFLYFINYSPWYEKKEFTLLYTIKLALINLAVDPVCAYLYLHIIYEPLTNDSKKLSINHLLLLFILGIINSIIWFGIALVIYTGEEELKWVTFYRNFPEAIFSILSLVGIVVSNKWYRDKRNLELVKKNQDYELRLLRWQMDEHFIKNLISGLTELSREKNFDEYVDKIKELLDYVLYDCKQKEEVTIKSEIFFLKNYIFVRRQTKYFYRGINIKFDYPEKYDKNLSIVPLVLVEFLENAFKHGYDQCNEVNNVTPKIVMELKIEEDNFLLFRVYNAKPQPMHEDFSKNKSLGLSSVKQRLLHRYGKDYSLDIDYGSEYFQILLKLKLNKIC